LTPAKGTPATIENTRGGDWLTKAGVKPGQSFVLDGYFDVDAADVYQFQCRSAGPVVISVDGASLKQPPGEGWMFLPVSLTAGTHRVQVRGKATINPRLEIRFGGPGAASIGAAQFRHPAAPPKAGNRASS
jgi:hypothetical protein